MRSDSQTVLGNQKGGENQSLFDKAPWLHARQFGQTGCLPSHGSGHPCMNDCPPSLLTQSPSSTIHAIRLINNRFKDVKSHRCSSMAVSVSRASGSCRVKGSRNTCGHVFTRCYVCTHVCECEGTPVVNTGVFCDPSPPYFCFGEGSLADLVAC